MSNQEPGSVLREAREEAGLSEQDVADSLNLLVSHVEAMEANQFQQMNADIFVRGYVRSYARFLNLDAESLLEATEAFLKPAAEQRAEQQFARGAGLSPLQKLSGALVVAALVWAGANWWLGESADDKAGTADVVEQDSEV